MLRAFGDGTVFGDVHGDGPARIVALHGWRRDRSDWAAALAGLDAVAVDLPGFGASPAPDDAWGAAEYAAAVAPVLDTCAPGPVVVAGHSFGGTVALHLAATRPERVGGLLLTGTPRLVSLPDSRPSVPSLGFRLVRRLHRLGLVGDARMERLRRARGSADYNAAEGVMRDVFVRAVNERFDTVLARVRCPVELVWGGDDSAAPLAVAREAAARLGEQAHLQVLPGAGHLTVVTAVPALREALARLLVCPGRGDA